MNSIMEWVFTANLHPYQIVFWTVAGAFVWNFLEGCYGKLRRRP